MQAHQGGIDSISRTMRDQKLWDRLWTEDSNWARGWLEHRYDPDFLASKRVLEVACGASAEVADLARRSARAYVGVDISRVALEIYRRDENLGDPLVQADAVRLPFKDNAFDVAFLGNALNIFAWEAFNALREIARVSRALVFNAVMRFETEEPKRAPLVVQPNPLMRISLGEVKPNDFGFDVVKFTLKEMNFLLAMLQLEARAIYLQAEGHFAHVETVKKQR